MSAVYGVLAFALLFALFGMVRQRAGCGSGCGCGATCRRSGARRGEESRG